MISVICNYNLPGSNSSYSGPGALIIRKSLDVYPLETKKDLDVRTSSIITLEVKNNISYNKLKKPEKKLSKQITPINKFSKTYNYNNIIYTNQIPKNIFYLNTNNVFNDSITTNFIPRAIIFVRPTLENLLFKNVPKFLITINHNLKNINIEKNTSGPKLIIKDLYEKNKIYTLSTTNKILYRYINLKLISEKNRFIYKTEKNVQSIFVYNKLDNLLLKSKNIATYVRLNKYSATSNFIFNYYYSNIIENQNFMTQYYYYNIITSSSNTSLNSIQFNFQPSTNSSNSSGSLNTTESYKPIILRKEQLITEREILNIKNLGLDGLEIQSISVEPNNIEYYIVDNRIYLKELINIPVYFQIYFSQGVKLELEII